jgi:hypothetical protein
VAYVLAPQALANLATVKAELNLTVTSFDDALTRLINTASDVIAKYCQRDFYLNQWTEPVGIPGTNRARIRSDRFPVLLPPYAPNPSFLTALDPGPGQPLNYGTDFYLEDGAAGFFFRQYRWTPTGLHRPDIAQDWDPDAIEAQDSLTYVAGFRTQPQIDVAATYPGPGNVIALLRIIKPTAFQNQLWQCTVGGFTGTEPSWPATPAIGTTQLDNQVTWVYIGTQDQARTLPYDLEQACIETVCNFFRRRGQALDMTIDKLGDAQKTFNLQTGRPQLPPSVKEACNQFRRIWIG